VASRKPKLENGKDFQRPDAVLLEWPILLHRRTWDDGA
jgi:hypothetical protein